MKSISESFDSPIRIHRKLFPKNENKSDIDDNISHKRTPLESSLEALDIKMASCQLEGPWNNQIEELMLEWKNICKIKADQHSKSGYEYKKKNTHWGLPSVLLPISMAPISIMIGYDTCSDGLNWQTVFNSSLFLLSGICSGVYSFYRYGEKMEQFFNFSARYYDIVTEIEAELINNILNI